MSSTFETNCGQCGALLPSGATACPRCGAPVKAQPSGSTTPPSGAASEYFPGIAEQLDSAETLVRMRPEEGWSSQPSGVTPFGAPPASGTAPAPGQMPPAGPGDAAPASFPQPSASSPWPMQPPTPAAWPTPAPQPGPAAPMMGASQPFGAPPAMPAPSAPNWPSTPLVGSVPQGGTYPGQPGPVTQGGWPTGETFTQSSAPGQAMPPGFGAPPGAYPPGFSAPPGAYAPGFGVPGAPAQRLPLPRWFTIGVAVLVAVGLALIWLTGSDWANGGLRAGIAALVVGVIVLGAFLFRFNQGYKGTRTVSLAVASVLILIVVGVAGLALQSSVHSLQGNSLEGQAKSASDIGTAQKDFQTAIQEFTLAGDPEGVARTYNDWGEQLSSQHKYQVPADPTQTPTDGTKQNTNGAINKFEVVLSHYSSVTDQMTRALEDEASAYLAWGDQYLKQSDYQNAVNAFKDAIAKKDALGNTSAYPNIHQDAAKAYYQLGQQQITSGTTNGDCTSAVQTYQVLAQDYSDTSPGQMAATDLKKPQSVTGKVISVQTGQRTANVRLFLSAKWQLSNNTFSASDDFTVLSDANGNFVFSDITPGDTKYLISYVGSAGGETITVSRASGQPQNVVQVMPLCPTDAGTIDQF